MLQAGLDADLAEEALGAEAGGQLGMKHLDRDGAVVLEVAGEVHGRHAAAAQRALDGIAVGQGLLEPYRSLEHRAAPAGAHVGGPAAASRSGETPRSARPASGCSRAGPRSRARARPGRRPPGAPGTPRRRRNAPARSPLRSRIRMSRRTEASSSGASSTPRRASGAAATRSPTRSASPTCGPGRGRRTPPEPAALTIDPLLEFGGNVRDMDAGEQVAAVECECLGPVARLTGLVEVGGIALHAARDSRRRPLRLGSPARRFQLPAQETQRLPQCSAGMLRVELGPEEGRPGCPAGGIGDRPRARGRPAGRVASAAPGRSATRRVRAGRRDPRRRAAGAESWSLGEGDHGGLTARLTPGSPPVR